MVYGFTNKHAKHSIIYGKNNYGKTFLLKEIAKSVLENNINEILDHKINGIPLFEGNELKFKNTHGFVFYININREGTNDAEYVIDPYPISFEDSYFQTELDKIKNNSIIVFNTYRNWVKKNNKDTIINNALNIIFEDSSFTMDNYHQSSDGIKNVINIISFLLNIKEQTQSQGFNHNLILIDEIELFLDIKAQISLVDYLNKEFSDCFIF
jgi:ABC-type cobalamin/Fe3+-siderophores transport system ATPase subunit